MPRPSRSEVKLVNESPIAVRRLRDSKLCISDSLNLATLGERCTGVASCTISPLRGSNWSLCPNDANCQLPTTRAPAR